MGAHVDVQHPALAMGANVHIVRPTLPSFAWWQLKALQPGLGCARGIVFSSIYGYIYIYIYRGHVYVDFRC